MIDSVISHSIEKVLRQLNSFNKYGPKQYRTYTILFTEKPT